MLFIIKKTVPITERFFTFILNWITLRSRRNEHFLLVHPNRHTFLQLRYSSLVVHRNRISDYRFKLKCPLTNFPFSSSIEYQ
jgi:hypothetical protein